jgi:hypothetical protein
MNILISVIATRNMKYRATINKISSGSLSSFVKCRIRENSDKNQDATLIYVMNTKWTLNIP